MGSIWDIVALAAVEIWGDFNLKWQANERSRPDQLVQGVLGQIGVIYFLIRSLTGSTVLQVNGMWDGISTLIENGAAQLVLGERLERTTQQFGLVLTIVGIFLLKH